MSFKELSNHLLDLGKRNRLLNYKEAGYKGISVLAKNTDSLYRGIIDSKEYKIIPLKSILECQSKLTTDLDSDISSYSTSKVLDIASPVVKPNELICWKQGYNQERVLKSLAKEYNFSIREKGINTLYLAFGFVEYTENKVSYRAPLLLIPLFLEKLQNGYKIKEREDEIILNPTLHYYFKENFNLNIPTIASEDEELSSYLNRVNKALKGRFTVHDEIVMGIFSFSKMNMYADLVNNERVVTSNPCIRALIYGEQLPYLEDKNVKIYPVKDYDSTQLEAIRLAAMGNSFTLQGPPGSGKSQTITNIIATLIGNGKKVLFVSEKLAALQVVYNNLKRVGLQDFAIELHSNKANKNDFISELYRTATLPQYKVSSRGDDYLEEREAYKSYLDSYIMALYKKNDDNASIYDEIIEYLAIPNNGFSYDMRELNGLKYKEINEVIRALNDYSNAIKPLGYSYKDLIFHVLISLSYEYVEYEINNDLEASVKYLYKLNELKDNLNKYIKIDNKEIISLNELYKAMDFVSKINLLAYKREAYFNKASRNKIIKALDDYSKSEANLPNISDYDKEVLELDLKEIYRYIKGSKSFIGRLFDSKYKGYKRTLLGYRNKGTSYNGLVTDLERLVAYKDKKATMDLGLGNLKKLLGGIDKDKIAKDLELTKDFIGYQISFENKDALTDALIAFRSYYGENLSLNKLAKNINPKELDIFDGDMKLALLKLKELYLKRGLIKEYYNVDEALGRIRSLNAIGFLDSYLEKGMELKELATSFKRELLRGKIINGFMKAPILGGFNSEQFNQKVKDFASLDSKALDINRDIIIASNSANRPDDMIMGSAFSLLSRENSKLKRKMPIRMVMDGIMDFILAIKPVFLMSPLSVSTYLNSESGMFDCVIFDEASQIFAWDALGAIYRAKQCIIIGDSKQMPPSAFFNSYVEADEDDYDAIDMESILDMASSSLINASLRWHYRSRSEELIEFSNNNFYDHRLITIPGASMKHEGLGIDLIYLENGVYDSKTRTNMAEALKICDLVIEHLATSTESLGVVAFSQVQSDLIEDLLEERIRKNPELAKLFRDDIDEPFFVKNLETVQGDERDRIIFSICYGYNENKKFYQRFGPLNNIGGERRLNVAITRAKYNITVVTSIKYNDIKPSEALGCILLHDYLKFCSEVTYRSNNKTDNNALINDINSFIKENGYDTATNYGSSDFKISIAVRNSDKTAFSAAIMVDNEYDTKTNTTDRCRLLEMLLERQGFKYYRIYAPAWFNSKEIEKERLLSFLKDNNTSNEAKPNKAPEHESYLSVDDELDSLENQFREYKKADSSELLKIFADEGADKMISKLIESEAPIKREYLYKRVSEVLEKKSVTKLVRNLVDANIPTDIIVNNDTYWLRKPEMIGLRINSNRAIDEIPIEELMDGIRIITKEAMVIDKKDCYKSLSKLLGFKRLTENAITALDNALVFLELEGKIVVANDKLSI